VSLPVCRRYGWGSPRSKGGVHWYLKPPTTAALARHPQITIENASGAIRPVKFTVGGARYKLQYEDADIITYRRVDDCGGA